MKKKKNLKRPVVYVTIDDISSGLFASQVIGPLVVSAENDKVRQFQLLVLNRPWKFLNHRTTLKMLRRSVLPNNMSIRYIPFLPPLRNSAGNRLYSILVTNYLSILVRFFAMRGDIVYHTRSYWPCAATLKAGFKSVIFEPRSLWTLENIAMGDIREGSRAEEYWHAIEKTCVLKSERVVSINSAMANYFSMQYDSSSKNEVIPISFSNKKFTYNTEARDKIRQKLFLNDKTVFVYSGSFGMSQVGLSIITKIVRMLNDSISDAHFLFLTPNYEKTAISKVVLQAELGEKDFTSIHPSFDQISDYLSAADFGYHALPLQLDSFTRMGTKVVEYLATGLPVIVNRNVGAAAEILDKYPYGLVIDEEMSKEEVSEKLGCLLNLRRADLVDFAKEQFEVTAAAKSYAKIYHELDVSKDGGTL